MIHKIRCYTDSFGELFLITFGVIIFAATAYSFVEGESWGTSLWWAVVTGATVGYGDEFPVSVPGRIIGGLLIAFCVLFLVPMITARIAATLIVDNNAFTHKEQEQLKTGVEELHVMVQTNNSLLAKLMEQTEAAGGRTNRSGAVPRIPMPMGLVGQGDSITIPEFNRRMADKLGPDAPAWDHNSSGTVSSSDNGSCSDGGGGGGCE